VLNLPTHQNTAKKKSQSDKQSGKTAHSKARACLPATLQLFKVAGRSGKSASCTTASHKRVQTTKTAGAVATPVYVAPNVVSFTPVTVPSSSSEWGGSVMSNPFTPVQVERYAQLVGALSQPPAYLVKIYKAAARMYKIPWQVLAAINYVETGYGADPYVSSAGAIGWMQFMPGTWARYGEVVDVRGRVVAHTASAGAAWNARDAIFSAARYLVAHGALSNLPKAIFAYNHAYWYVQEVLQVAEQIDSQGMRPSAHVGRRISSMRTTAELLNGMPYVWGGGHSSWAVSVGYDCSGFVSAVLHAGGYLSQPVTTQSLPVQNGIVSGPGRWITIFDRTDGGSMESDHVIIDIDGQWWESGGTSTLGVHRIRNMTAGYLQTFNVVLHPHGL
jgi:membrane-bound lytic murein transglycosylase B